MVIWDWLVKLLNLLNNSMSDLFTPKQGDRIRCIEMVDDPNPVESGTEGTIEFIDDINQIHVKWDNGRSLSLLPGIDKYELIGTNENNVKDFTDFRKEER